MVSQLPAFMESTWNQPHTKPDGFRRDTDLAWE